MLQKIWRRIKGGLDPQSVVDQFIGYCTAVRTGRARGFDELVNIDEGIFTIWQASFRHKLQKALAPLTREEQQRNVRRIVIDGLENQSAIEVVYFSSALTDRERGALFDGKKPAGLVTLMSFLDVMATDTVLLHFFKDQTLSPAVISHMHLSVIYGTIELKSLAILANQGDEGGRPCDQYTAAIASRGLKTYCEQIIIKLRSGWVPCKEDGLKSDERILSLRDDQMPITSASKLDKLLRASVVLWPFLDREVQRSNDTIRLDLAKLAVLDICTFLVLVERYSQTVLSVDTVKAVVDEVLHHFELALMESPCETSVFTEVALLDLHETRRDELVTMLIRVAGIASIPYLDKAEQEIAFVVTKFALLLGILDLGPIFPLGHRSLLPEQETIGAFIGREQELIEALDSVF